MGGGPVTTQNTNQQGVQNGNFSGTQNGVQSGTATNATQSSPWAPTQAALTGLIGNLGNYNTGVSGDQSSAISSLLGGANGLSNFGPQATNTANNLFGGGNANQYAPMLQGAYGDLQSSLSPLTNPANLNPMNTPGFSDALGALNTSIGNQVNDRFAAAGRDLSPGNTTALAQGLSQGEGQLISNQYNANAGNLMNASNSPYGAGAGTANALTGYNQLGNSNQLAGASLAGSIPGLAMSPAQAQLYAANQQQNLPLQNMGSYESLLAPLAALGTQGSSTVNGNTSGTNNVNSSGVSAGNTSTQGQSTSQTQTPLWQQLAGLGIAGAGLFGAPTGGTSAASGLSSLFGNLFGSSS